MIRKRNTDLDSDSNDYQSFNSAKAKKYFNELNQRQMTEEKVSLRTPLASKDIAEWK